VGELVKGGRTCWSAGEEESGKTAKDFLTAASGRTSGMHNHRAQRRRRKRGYSLIAGQPTGETGIVDTCMTVPVGQALRAGGKREENLGPSQPRSPKNLKGREK